MMRGIREVTVEDSRRAARRELGRVAVSLAADAEHVQSQLAELGEWLVGARTLLLDVDLDVARRESVTHARPHDTIVGHDEDAELATTLGDAIARREREYAVLSGQLRQSRPISVDEWPAPVASVGHGGLRISM